MAGWQPAAFATDYPDCSGRLTAETLPSHRHRRINDIASLRNYPTGRSFVPHPSSPVRPPVIASRSRRWPATTRRALGLIAGPLALSLTLSACGSSDSAPAAQDTAPRPGGTLTFALATDPTCLDPQQAGLNASLNIGRQLVDSLIDQDPKTAEFKPWLAESWQVNDTATSFTYKLKPGATFSDGTPVDAAAVKVNFDSVVKLGAKAVLAASYLSGYTGTTVVDQYTAKVDFNKPSAQFLQASSTMSLGLLASTTLAKTPEQRCQGDLIGSGPFTFESYTAKQNVVLVKRKGYNWGSSLWLHTGAAYLNKITYKIIPESGVRAGSLTSGQVSSISDVQPQDEAQFASGGLSTFVRGNPGIPFSLSPNTTRPVLSEEPVRQAIQKGINRAEVVQTVLSPNYKAGTSALAASTPGYTDLSNLLAYDPNGAKALLDGAGWALGADGIRAKGGQRLSVGVVFNSAFNGSQTVLELVQQQLKTLGVELKLQLLTTGDIAKVQASGDYDFLWFNLTRADPDVLRTIYSTKASNRAYLKPGPLDDLLDRQASTTDTAQRKDAVAQAQRHIIEQGYQIPVFELSQVHGLGAKTKGLRFEASSRLTFFDTWLAS
jgi:peptide/nickel transport system substrate-binding protein